MDFETRILRIKQFHFPSFEDWYKDGEMGHVDYTEELGGLTCRIAESSWGCNGNCYNGYEAAVSTASNPLNIYNPKIIHHKKNIRYDDLDAIRNWYEETTKKVNQEWMQWVYDNFLE